MYEVEEGTEALESSETSEALNKEEKDTEDVSTVDSMVPGDTQPTQTPGPKFQSKEEYELAMRAKRNCFNPGCTESCMCMPCEKKSWHAPEGT